jgi:hypothetical protein
MNNLKRTDFTASRNSDTSAIHSIIQYTDKSDMSLTDIMGYTAHAFRIIVDREAVEVGSYSFFDWKLHHTAVLQNLGFSVQTAGKQTNTPPTPEELAEAIGYLQESIDQGVPGLSWDLFIPEWGNIYGYDDEKRVFRCRDVQKDDELPYEKLGRGEVTELYVLTIIGSHPVDKRSMLKGALRLAIDHAYQQYSELEQTNYRNGIAAYDAWIEAFTNRNVDPFGNAVNVAKICDAREFAYQFLLELAVNWVGSSSQDEGIRELAKLASDKYLIVAERFGEMKHPMFPFPQGGEPNSDDQAKHALVLLQEAKAAESKGLQLLKQIHELLEH